MKVVVCPKYGSPDVVQLKEVEKPTPKDNEVLVKVVAASVNATDLEIVRGYFFVRLAGPRKPSFRILGCDLAGLVEVVGRNVKQFQRGDEIYMDMSALGYGAFAEYVCVPEKSLRLKPASMTFEEAATIPQAAVLALQGIRGKRQIQPGQKVLVNGAGGGVGTFAVQIAKSFGAEVTGVDNTRKLDLMRSIGADHVIDYTQEDFTKKRQRYDLILDVVGYRSIFAFRRILRPKGIYAMVGGSTARIFQAMLLGPLISIIERKKIGIMLGRPNKREDMDFLKEQFEAGKVVPVIDRCYPLSEVAEALRYLEKRQTLGKLVITMEHNNKG